MPQLNPAPWFLIMLFSWCVFLIFLPPKIMAHAFPNEPSSQNTCPKEIKPWTWTWH
uniref:ATP synthase complex subunit 8 n=1 Tax=Polyspina piosae TaxID=862797 RepID=F2EMB6_9TELE|nr:ATP synthase F0 subunit 8 [Polyspina piosae]BAK09734.1 ATPase subunit 8 [Polyspina piosae]